ncbi:jg18636 [Pararge aegeria aegeria]|uniref:Jg18636 protein n=1 Tax=Pararge aegeria aegeria TaxID=348720 RepID=A0A8S4RBJ3_9NEOP|nr:jg18636 [Pararge aegeria aegeria]
MGTWFCFIEESNELFVVITRRMPGGAVAGCELRLRGSQACDASRDEFLSLGHSTSDSWMASIAIDSYTKPEVGEATTITNHLDHDGRKTDVLCCGNIPGD